VNSNLRRNSTFRTADETHEIEITGGEKAESFEHLQTLPSQKKFKAQEEEWKHLLDLLLEQVWTVRSVSGEAKGEHRGRTDPSHRI
jgi:hypothetical protein